MHWNSKPRAVSRSLIVGVMSIKMKRYFLTVAAFMCLFISPFSWAEKEVEKSREEYLSEMCKKHICRKNLDFKLKSKDGSILEYKADLAPPIFRDGVLSIYPGEVHFVEITESKAGGVELKVVSENKKPEKTIIFKFVQAEKLGHGKDMLLTITNPLRKTFRYSVGMVLPDQPRSIKTSSCPVKANMSGNEHWPHPIYMLLFKDFKFLKENESMACE